jgi:rhomboid protease GlpG
MRHIGNLPDAEQSHLFGDYLYAQGIPNEIEQDGDKSWMVWVAAEEQLDAARGLLDRFRSNPAAPEFARVAANAEERRVEKKREEEAFRRRFFTRSRIFPNAAGTRSGLWTYLLIAASVAVTLYSGFGEDMNRLQPFFISAYGRGAGFLPEVFSGQVWRLFTPALIHFGPLHLFFDMLWLFYLGGMIESRQGHTFFVLLVLALAVGSNVAQYTFQGPMFGGMSGVVYGLFGYVWLRGKLDPESGLFIDRTNTVLMIVWLFLGFSGKVGLIANFAHGAGLVLGAGYGAVSGLWARRK